MTLETQRLNLTTASTEDPDLDVPKIFNTYGYKKDIALPRNPALTPAQADEPCNRHTPENLLKELNKLTGYDLDMSEPNLEAGVGILINGTHDIGRAYAWFRTAFVFTATNRPTSQFGFIRQQQRWIAWYSGLPDISNCDSSLTTVNQPGVDAVDQRKTAIQDIDGEGVIINPDLYHPRRLWDILANRVIPYEWHARTTRMFYLNIETGYTILTGNIIRITDPFFDRLSGSPIPHTKFNAEYAKRLANWTQMPFQKCVPYAAISHSWAANLKYVLSPVNNQMWPVPLPTDIALDEVRQNLLDFRLPEDCWDRFEFWEVHALPYEVEYCWLDNLCLRQAWANSSGDLLTEPAHPSWQQLETTRLEEWAIDVPTIGSIYQRSSDILLYLNGIGRPVSLVKEDWESPYHWINRAWTLQESTGLESSGPGNSIVMHTDKLWDGRRDKSGSMATLAKRLPFQDTYNVSDRLPDVTVTSGSCIVRLINAMARRHASNEMDKIAGLFFLIGCGGALPHFPIYKPGENIESAWLRLVNALNNSWRWSLSIHCPQFPDQLFPTWRSLCNLILNSPQPDFQLTDRSGTPWHWGVPGFFDISSSAPLMNTHPLVGLQPLVCCLLTTTGEHGQVFRKLQTLPGEARGIKQDHPSVIVQWHLSPRVRPDSAEIYYLIPYMLPRPFYPRSERCSDWIVPSLTYHAYFLVCEPLLDEKSGRDDWDGIAFKKLGFTWIQHMSPSPNDVDWVWDDYDWDDCERDQPFWRFFDSVYTADLIPFVKEIANLTPKAAKEKYGKEKVYTLIY